MNPDIFRPADILLPHKVDLRKWSVVACDQYTSQIAYWDALDAYVGQAPSTLRLILPEAYLHREPVAMAEAIIRETMEDYVRQGVFHCIPHSYILVERKLQNGMVRRGLMGALDLDAYDFTPGARTPVRATEGTVADRVPVRVQVRQGAALEVPHTVVFIDDPLDAILGPLTSEKTPESLLYDFPLYGDGGQLTGYLVGAAAAADLQARLSAYCDKPGSPVRFAVGDGNHSLAAAKTCWEQLRPRLSRAEQEVHPARYSLVELVNIHDPSIVFEPIHKVLFQTDQSHFFSDALRFWEPYIVEDSTGDDTIMSLVCGDESVDLGVGNIPPAQLIDRAEMFCQDYVQRYGGHVDYVHNDDTAYAQASVEGGAAILLPPINKTHLFKSVNRSGPFPRKSFSVGRAEDKRYYFECRAIRPIRHKRNNNTN